VKDRFVKGQYMAADMLGADYVWVEPVPEPQDITTCPGYDDDLPVCPVPDPIIPPPSFKTKIIRPQTFGLAI